jgi:hypothetical protein
MHPLGDAGLQSRHENSEGLLDVMPSWAMVSLSASCSVAPALRSDRST